MSRKSLFSSFLVVFLCFFSVQLFAETLTMGSALNKAGRQRMLTQNILKNYLALGLDIDVMRSRKELDRSVALFEEQFQELTEYAPTDTVKRSLSKVEDLWFEYRSLAISRVSKENAAKMLDSNNAILGACHQVVLDLEAYAGRKSAKMVNTSGRQRMLSQRIALYYLAHAWGFRDAEYVSEFEKAKREYGAGLTTLTTFEQNTPDIRESLKKVTAQWQFSNTGFEQLDNGNYVPHVISVTTTGMLKRMDSITHLYENLDISLSAGVVASTVEP
jgi:nitrate/nitrite-specific signal transduction histidine kinase